MRIYTYEGESSPRCPASPDLARFSVAKMLVKTGKRWEIDATMHLPLHLEWCSECNRFVKHVVDCCQSGFESLIKTQKDHWMEELHHIALNAYDDGYDVAKKKKRAREDELEDRIEDLCERIQVLERENTRPTIPDIKPMNISPPHRVRHDQK